MSLLTDYAANKILDAILNGDATARSELSAASFQMALVLTTPTTATENIASANEVSGGSYARISAATMAAAFPAASGGSLVNSADLAWPTSTAAWGTVLGVVWVDNTTGKVWLFYPVSGGLSVASNNIVKWASGNLTIEAA